MCRIDGIVVLKSHTVDRWQSSSLLIIIIKYYITTAHQNSKLCFISSSNMPRGKWPTCAVPKVTSTPRSRPSYPVT